MRGWNGGRAEGRKGGRSPPNDPSFRLTALPPYRLSARHGARRMIRWASERPAVIWAFGVSLMLAGGVAFTRLPLATRTSVELPRLSVTASWPGASAELLETYVTSPIEAAIQGVRGVRKSSSESGDGGRGGGGGGVANSRITVELEPGVDVQLTRLAIHERLELLRNDFPLGV